MVNKEDVRKELRFAKALALFEGICFFVAGICAMMAGNVLGYISGVLVIILAGSSLAGVFFGGDDYFFNMGAAMALDETMEEFNERTEGEQK